MATKFNQELYAKMRVKKNEPLSSLAQKLPWATKEVVETTTSTTVASDLKATSSAAYIKEISLVPRRLVVVTRGRARLMLVFGMMLPLLWEGPTTSSLPRC